MEIIKMKNPAINKDISLQLSLLKLIACIGVMYIHAYMLHFNFFTITPDKLPAVYYVQTIISKIIAQVSVPIFLVVSGYIYASKQYQDNNWQFFCRKTRGILFPYFLWNSIALFYIFLLQIPSFAKGYFSSHLLISSFDANAWLNAYFGLSNSWLPFLYPLWFLPYLFAALMLVHITRKWHEKLTWLPWVLIALNFISAAYVPLNSKLAYCGPYLRLLMSMAFFTMGMMFVKNRQLIEKRGTAVICAVIFIAASTADLAGSTPNIKWKTLAMYAGVSFIFFCTCRVDKCKEKIKKIILFLSGFSFMVYLTHEYILSVLIKLIYPALPPETLYILLVYFLMPLLLTSVLITSGYLFKKLFPKVYSFLFSAR